MTEEKRFKFDLNKLTYDEFISYYGEVDPENPEDMNLSDQEAKEMLAKVLVDWPVDMEISAENIGKLGILDFKEMQETFSEVMQDTFDVAKN